MLDGSEGTFFIQNRWLIRRRGTVMEKDVINILIVDDEKYEGILMEKSVAWESEGFHIMGNVQCAEDALALMEKQTPDIVYTDINMPRIDGLELSRRIRETYPAVHIVIVTGYREFEYAREAIHIGVEEFLLKPIQSDELLAAAVKLREQILKEREQQSKDVEIYPVLCQELLRRIVTGYIKSEESGEKLSEYQIRLWKNNGVRGFLLLMDLEDHDVLLKLLEIMNKTIGEKKYGYFFLEKNKIFFVIEETPEIKDLLGTAFEQITELGKNGTAAASVSSYYEKRDDSPKILSECEEALVDTMRDERKTLIFYEDYIEYMQQISHSYPVNFDSYRIAVKSGDQEAAVGFIDHYLEQYIFNGPLMISQLRNLGVLLFHNTMSVLKESNKHLDNEEQVKILENISGINTLQEFCRTLYALIEGTIQTISRNAGGNTVAQKAQEYIEQNLDREKLSLNLIASDLFVNASYLSRIFKQSVGESITKYIMRKRVEKSMELFDTTDLKVYEVAAAVGMPDAHYFGTSFKKYTGKTVNEYKSKNRTLSGK
ncbi:response regulator [Ruminococcus sp. AF21-42]|uniref:Stage 0 sporulation protein A homolog n=4 Tax=Blautia luti TaxID=89014 RepID=A0A844GML8_9FIRM|nr:response regulator [Blautia luti DSM 14534 = JCM 17040]RHQ88513.1 response regulator [Ruminococcus sp. AF21-42]